MLGTAAEDGFPIPPPKLQLLVAGGPDFDFLAIGRVCAETVAGSLNRAGVDFASLPAILDFGCGCGRVIRHMRSRTNARLHGTDYNPRLIQWCRRHLPFGEFQVNELSPPLAYPREKFDLIYSFSVFTHLPEPLQVSWMQELARVLRPGGYLLITTHGQASAEACLSSVDRRQFDEGKLVVIEAELAGQNECAAFHPQSYVESLAEDFEVIEFVPGGLLDLIRNRIEQDVYLLRKN